MAAPITSRFTLATRAALMLSVLFISAFGALAYRALQYFEDRFTALAGQHQETLLREYANKLSGNMAAAHTTLIASAKIVDQKMLASPATARDFLEARTFLLSSFQRGLYLVDKGGQTVAYAVGSPSATPRDLLPAEIDLARHTLSTGIAQTSAAFAAVGNGHIPLIAMSAPVRGSDGAVIGVMQGSFALLDKNYAGTLGNIKIGINGYLFLTTRDRIMLLHPNPDRILAITAKSGQNIGLDRALDQGFEGTTETVNSTGLHALSTFVPVPGRDWVLAANFPMAEVREPFRRSLREMAGGAAAAALLLFGLVIVIVRRLMRPVRQLTERLEDLGKGVSRTMDLPGSPELDIVAGTFNKMVHALSASEAARLEGEISVRELNKSQQRSIRQLHQAQSIAHLGSWEYDLATNQVEWSDELYRVYGVSPETFAPSVEDFIGLVLPDDQAAMKAWISACASGGEPGPLEFRYVGSDGGIRHVEWQGELEVDGQGKSIRMFGTGQDITARKIAEQEITYLAFYDSLTQLPNRRLLMDRLQQAQASNARTGRNGALLLLDLDDFKTLNDTLGHDKGDLLLQQAAQRLVSSIREGDTVARLGGDEFVVLLNDLSENAEESATQAEMLGEKIRARLSQHYDLDGSENNSTASIGIVLFSGNQNAIEDLLKQADLAMYQAKSAGRNALCFFDPKMQILVTERANLVIELRAAVKNQQFVIHYQPQVVGAGHITGAEALVRWQHPQRGVVSPAEFIPIAEETGLIVPMGIWVLETACTQLTKWSSQPGMNHFTLAVNVCAKQLEREDFVEMVLSVIERTGANPQLLKLELTESLLVTNLEDSIAKMYALKARGVGFSLDDFGTGFSSLSYLKRLPLDQLKIDQGFVRDILSDPDDAAIAKTVIVLAESLGLNVIAEGVEIEEQREFLARQGCHAYQGYLFSRPLPLQDFEAFVNRV